MRVVAVMDRDAHAGRSVFKETVDQVDLVQRVLFAEDRSDTQAPPSEILGLRRTDFGVFDALPSEDLGQCGRGVLGGVRQRGGEAGAVATVSVELHKVLTPI
ncbi:hypothetical protein LP52_05445 [Streptomonospora alba]|uniref:Uncharacterized protein n=1 Tax=Streptomonospora alba TaxID=183763 RepID=A0A0C2JL83_9ACTN|nr:hypothetical protein LP52_05445 [Streptomonospora alba]